MKLAAIVLCLMSILAGAGFCDDQGAQVQFGFSKELIYPPDRIEVWMKASGLDRAGVYDAYIKVLTPAGKQVYVPGFADKPLPAVASLTLASGAEDKWQRLAEFEMPSREAPITETGEHKASLWLCRKGEDKPVAGPTNLLFTVALCGRASWVNDNDVSDVRCVGDEIYVGFPGGVALLSADGSSRRIFKSEDGPGTARTKLWRGPNGELLAAGLDDHALFVREPYGWRMLRDREGNPFPGLPLMEVAADGEGGLWAKCRVGEEGAKLIRRARDGQLTDYSGRLPDASYRLCTVSGKTLCAVTLKGVFVFTGNEFEFQQFPDDPFWSRGWLCGPATKLVRPSTVMRRATSGSALERTALPLPVLLSSGSLPSPSTTSRHERLFASRMTTRLACWSTTLWRRSGQTLTGMSGSEDPAS